MDLPEAESCNTHLSKCWKINDSNKTNCYNFIKNMTLFSPHDKTLSSDQNMTSSINMFSVSTWHKPSPKEELEWSKRQKCMQNVHSKLQQCLPELTQTCLDSSITATKLIRLRLSDAALILDQDPDVVIVYYYKDPRALALSVYGAGAKHGAERICSDMRSDLAFYEKLSDRYPGRLYHFRYEDIVTNYKETLEKLYDFVGAELPLSVLNFYHNALGGFGTDFSMLSTYRENSTHTAFRWKHELSEADIKIIESHCSDVIQKFHYPLFSADMLV